MSLRFALSAGLGLFALAPTLAVARNKDYALKGHALPSDKPVTIMLMRPDVQVGELAAGGLPTPNADWTKAAREHLANALSANQKKRNIDFYGSKLPTKKGKTKKDHVFDWTLGPGTQQIGDLAGGNYALFFFARDNFASASRKAMQVAGMLGCIVGACFIVSGGQHVAYASLVEASTGNVVWFNILRGSKGDVREADGAQSMVDAIMDSMPTRAGEAPPAPAKKRK
jgi:hypothetical protein